MAAAGGAGHGQRSAGSLAIVPVSSRVGAKAEGNLAHLMMSSADLLWVAKTSESTGVQNTTVERHGAMRLAVYRSHCPRLTLTCGLLTHGSASKANVSTQPLQITLARSSAY